MCGQHSSSAARAQTRIPLFTPFRVILVVNAIRNNLQHPNESRVWSTATQNAAFALYAIQREAEHLMPDAAELMTVFLAAGSDVVCKHNVFVFLTHASMERAVLWIAGNSEAVQGTDESMQMAIVDVVRMDSKVDSTHKPRYIKLIFDLLDVPSHAVKYEAATTVTPLTQNPGAVKAAASSLINLVLKESDNNVLICSADMEVRRKAMSIVLAMTSSRNVEELVLFLKKQLQKTQEAEFEKAAEYRQLLIQFIHVTAIKFSEVAASVVHALLDFVGDTNNPSVLDVVAFVREVTEIRKVIGDVPHILPL